MREADVHSKTRSTTERLSPSTLRARARVYASRLERNLEKIFMKIFVESRSFESLDRSVSIIVGQREGGVRGVESLETLETIECQLLSETE